MSPVQDLQDVRNSHSPVPRLTAPSFYITGRQPLRPGAILLAAVLAVLALSAVLYGLGHSGRVRLAARDRSASATAGGAPRGKDAEDKDADDKDDPSQIDTIVLGDPADAPVPGRKGDHVSPVHPTILVHLPRFGDQVGLIPDTAAGRLLYAWLAAFNQANQSALGEVLPNAAPGATGDAQMELRRETGGFSLLSAKEVQPGVLVFRLRDQTPAGTEALGTLEVRANSNPAAVASFSLRGVPSPRQNASGGAVTPR